jgi:putative regulator of septum formation
MTKLSRVVALLAAPILGLAGTSCAHDAGSSAGAALPSPPPSSASASSSRTSAASDVPPPPKEGQCRNTPASHLDPNDWVDNTPVVDCSKPHTLETVGVIKPVEKLTLAQAKQLVASCESPALSYLGISFPAVRTLAGPAVYWPSPAQRAAGQNWLRCDMGVQATTFCCNHLALMTGSLRGAVGSDPVRFQLCTNQLPAPDREQPLTSCKKPHRTEVLTDGLRLDVTKYPPPAVLNKKGRSGCAQQVADRKDHASLDFTWSWQSKGNWSGGTLFGFCWVNRKSGRLGPIT